MMRDSSLVCLFLVCFSGYSATQQVEPSGPIARLGSTPVIDGVFDAGEWDDAVIVRADTIEQFRIKHDGVNLYFAVNAGGGNLVFNTDAGVRILHWSAQLGSAEYVRSDTLTQSLDKPYAFELWGLYEESPDVIQEALATYLAEHGWAANTASMGELMQSELVISFDWLGVNTESGRFVEIPSVRIGAGLLIARGDPRAEQLARRAYELRPDSSAVTDTLGWILVKKGNLGEGVALLRKAAGLEGATPDVRYHLAAALAESGEKNEARSILEALLESEESFASKGEAESLLAELSP